jgi:hypothetical protein
MRVTWVAVSIRGLADEIRRELSKTSAPSGAAHGHQFPLVATARDAVLSPPFREVTIWAI